MPDINIERETHIRISDPINAYTMDTGYTTYGTIYERNLAAPVEYTEGIESGSLYLNKILVDSELAFGKSHASRFEVNLHIDEDITGKEISVWQIDNGTTRYLFNGIVMSAKYETDDYFRHIIAYDKFYALSKIDVTKWWKRVWAGFTGYQISVLIRKLCGDFGIAIAALPSISYFSYMLSKTDAMQFSKISFTSLLQYLLEPACVIPYIDSGAEATYVHTSGQTETLEGLARVNLFKFSNNSSSYILVEDNVEKNSLELQDNPIIPQNAVKFLNEDGTTLGSVPQDTSDSDSWRFFVFKYNPILTGISETDLNQLLQYCYTTGLGNIYAYYPARLNMIVSDLTIPLGQLMRVKYQPGDFYHDPKSWFTYAFEITLSGAILIEQEIKSETSNNQTTANDTIDNLFNPDVSVEPQPLSITSGGTGADNASDARDNLGITELIADITDDITDIQTDITNAQDSITDIQDDVTELQTEDININERLKYLEYRSITNSLIAKDKVILTTDNGEPITVF